MTRRVREMLLAGACLALGAPPAGAQSGGLTDSLSSIELGGRAGAVGGAYTAIADDADSFVYNPAGLAKADRIGLTATQFTLFQETKFTAVSVVYPTLRRGSYGISMARLSAGGIERRDENNVQTGTADFSESAMRLGYAFPLSSRFLIGGNLTKLSRSLDGDSSGFMGLDAGLQYEWRGVELGGSMQNLISRKTGSTDDEMPRTTRLGAGYRVMGSLILMSAQIDLMPSMEYHVGVEYAPLRLISLRLGRGPVSTVLGLGLKYNRFRLDYAMNLGNSALGAATRLSFGMDFGGTSKDRKRALAARIFERIRIYFQEGLYAEALKRSREARRYDAEISELEILVPRLERVAAAGITEIKGKGGRESRMRLGVEAFLEGKDEHAKRAFTEILREDPLNETARKLAMLYKVTPGGLPTGPGLVKLKLYSAQMHFDGGEYEAAAKDCTIALEVDPKNAAAFVKLGSAYYAMGLIDAAVENWKRAIAIDPQRPSVREAESFMKAKRLMK